ncbi:oligopeptide/dipeptide ABC transporter ATP-binding protein [Pseudonocardia sp. GCM10023141]|uniref:oligopeptide/dipeptide ABC transporter ATP-binding protein n=1 Tax=Pseudonocardia sp. GCM10023141 TaxID=3252653 RepID=UPI00361C2C51
MNPLLDVRLLAVHAPITGGVLRDRVVDHRRVVDGVSLQITRGGAYGLVGESGSGASRVGRAVLRLVEPDGGRVLIDGVDVAQLHGKRLRAMRRRFQMVFPDPRSGLDPRRPVGALLAEAMRAHDLVDGVADERLRSCAWADAVGLPVAALDRYPHELTDLQCRRVGIAAALSVEPELLVAEEPVAALDVSGQAQVLNLLAQLRAEHALTLLVISRDLAVAAQVSDRIGVLYRGGLVEEGPTAELLHRPLHPYTRALLAAAAVADPDLADRRERIVLRADPDGADTAVAGCRFQPLCPWSRPARCAAERPPLRTLVGTGAEHRVACHHAEEIGREYWRQPRIPVPGGPSIAH